MSRRKKRRSSQSKKAPVTLHEPSPLELAKRAGSPLTGFVCYACGWIYIQGGGSGRKTCTKCRAPALRKYDGQSIDTLAATLIASETGHVDPIGNEVFIRNRFAQAFERFNKRKDAWATAADIARGIAGGEPSRALIAQVYRDWKSKSPAERERKKRKHGAEQSQLRKGSRSSRRRLFDELEEERREAERERVRKLKKGTIRKKLL